MRAAQGRVESRALTQLAMEGAGRLQRPLLWPGANHLMLAQPHRGKCPRRETIHRWQAAGGGMGCCSRLLRWLGHERHSGGGVRAGMQTNLACLELLELDHCAWHAHAGTVGVWCSLRPRWRCLLGMGAGCGCAALGSRPGAVQTCGCRTPGCAVLCDAARCGPAVITLNRPHMPNALLSCLPRSPAPVLMHPPPFSGEVAPDPPAAGAGISLHYKLDPSFAALCPSGGPCMPEQLACCPLLSSPGPPHAHEGLLAVRMNAK